METIIFPLLSLLIKIMSIKLYITAIESKEDGTAVTLFEDYLITFGNRLYY